MRSKYVFYKIVTLMLSLSKHERLGARPLGAFTP
jgi:hypothetical protein